MQGKAMEEKKRAMIISKCYVKPKYVVEDAKKPYYLCPVDLQMLTIGPIKRGFLFNHQLIQVSCILDKLKSSLSHTLVRFYPLAGQLETVKYEDEHKCLIFVDCNKGPGAKLIHASALHLSVSNLLSPNHELLHVVRSLFDVEDGEEKVINYDGHSNPLLTIQVNELMDGVFIGFTMNHCVGDGTSFMHFVTSLSEIFNNTMHLEYDEPESHISRPPLYKPFLPNGHGPIIRLPYLEPQEFITRADPGPIRDKIFHFSASTIAKLKAQANQEIGSTGSNICISSFQALSGLVWRSITRARNPSPEEETTCNVLVNARSRLNPPLSDDYVGNFLSTAKANCKAEKLLGCNLGWAAMVLHQQIMGRNHKAIDEELKGLAQDPYGSPGSNRVLIGGSTRFDLYGFEFGLSPAVAVRTWYLNHADGRVSANPGREGGGSVELEICLRPRVMAALEADEDFMKFVTF